MATIREWLNQAGFDWETGRVIVQSVEDDDCPGWREPIAAAEINKHHPILDKEFYTGHGAPQCPRFIAEDARAFYFPAQYDGATWLEILYKDIDVYLNIENPTPYPGE